MSALPEWRFSEPLRAFSKTGLDFAGPFEIKASGRGHARTKVYILVLTCLQTRALHLECTHGMDTSSVANAISRFVDVRGMPTDILSDNWSSFVTKDKELESWVRFLDKDSIIKATKANVDWHFTPPKGPHHGGVYEIMVKATKRAFKGLLPKSDLTFDEFRTLVSKCMGLVNCRPLTRVPTGLDDQHVILTPNHFLFGSLGGAVDTPYSSFKNKWTLICDLQSKFWKLFLQEMIPELRLMRKWYKDCPNLAVGDWVIEIDPNLPKGQWKLATVEELILSNDHKVRKVIIKTSNGFYERPIVNLCPLFKYDSLDTASTEAVKG